MFPMPATATIINENAAAASAAAAADVDDDDDVKEEKRKGGRSMEERLRRDVRFIDSRTTANYQIQKKNPLSFIFIHGHNCGIVQCFCTVMPILTITAAAVTKTLRLLSQTLGSQDARRLQVGKHYHHHQHPHHHRHHHHHRQEQKIFSLKVFFPDLHLWRQSW